MATQSYEELIASATKIKNNELPESNTHDVVGDHLVQMATKAQEEYNQRVTGICEYNVSKQFPTGGIEGSNKYTLELALQKVPTELRQTVGLKCSFLGEDGTLESWEYQGGTFTATGNWQAFGGKKIAELDNNKQNRTDYFESTNNANALKIKDAIKEIYIDSKYTEPLSVYRIIRKKTDDNKYYIYISNTTGTIGYKISYISETGKSLVHAYGNGMNMYAIIDWSVLDEGIDYRADVNAILNDNAYSLNQSPILSTYLSNNLDITNVSSELSELYDDMILGVSKIYEKLTYNVGEKVEETQKKNMFILNVIISSGSKNLTDNVLNMLSNFAKVWSKDIECKIVLSKNNETSMYKVGEIAFFINEDQYEYNFFRFVLSHICKNIVSKYKNVGYKMVASDGAILEQL